ncbi:MAG: lOG family protein [Chlamydiia bacterium]|nr:lOG family protein [Chlamydiia bacterium]
MSEYYHPPELSPNSGNAWKLFKIISEFVDGFDTLSTLGPAVSIFGSSRLPKTSPYYQLTIDIAHKLVKKGFSVITGAGPSLMEAANKGAQEAKGNSCGLVIDLPFESEPNAFIDPKLKIKFHYFFVRKVMFVRYAQGFVFMPGGYGTMDEFFEVLTLIQTKKRVPVPIYLVGVDYWKGLIHWLKEAPLSHRCIYEHDLDLFILTDDIDEIVNGMDQSYKDRLKLEDTSISNSS